MRGRGRGSMRFFGDRGGMERGAGSFRGRGGSRSMGGRGFSRGAGTSRGGNNTGYTATKHNEPLDGSGRNSKTDNNKFSTNDKSIAGKAVDKRPVPSQTQRVVTTVTENGTELPKKLNTKVFVDGLPYENEVKSSSLSVEEELMQFVIAWKVGKPLRLIKKDGQGFGFLVFQSPHSVDVAVRVLNGRKFLGRSLRVEVPKPRDMEGAGGSYGANDSGKCSYARQVLLSDLAKVAQPEIIREILRDVAPQLEKRLDSIKMTSKNRKAFLTFQSSEDVEAAVKFLDGFSMFGRRISAAQAAAPGSLPYSKAPIRSTALHAAEGVLVGDGDADMVAAAGPNHGDEGELVVPLGLDVPPANRPVNGMEKRKPAPAAAAKPNALPSNITGVTEKYNLLDNGPAEVFVGNLGEDVTEEQLKAHFSVCGKINSCKIIVNKNTRLPTGIASIVFAIPAYAAYAQKHMHGSCLRGHVLRVDRGEEASAPLVSELPPRDDEETIDEDGYMEHFGVTNKKEYFKGTSFEEKPGCGKKRARDSEAGGEKRKGKGKKNKGEPPKKASSPKTSHGCGTNGSHHSRGDDDDDDDEEHFFDVDEGDNVRAKPTGKQKNTKKGAPVPRKGVKKKGKGKKSS
ncbi:Triple RNA binding domain protein 3 [Trypanosoma equiperdum]|uniref:Triple RNA binding domain protein 3 n=1 Tax=Trypanosoma equiperdum TaxID=5694 RepID=A0A1G4I310_TRYEQ|nr:Triple RNA binding domain protein 3 [Trypanosoma equiperdum]